MKTKLDYLVVIICILAGAFGTDARIKLFGKGIEHDTEILPFLKGILIKSGFVDFSLVIAVAVIGAYFLSAALLHKQLPVELRQRWWYKAYQVLNYVLLLTPWLWYQGTRAIGSSDHNYSQRFLPVLDDFLGSNYYVLFQIDYYEAGCYYYTLLLNGALFLLTIYLVGYNNRKDGKREKMLLDEWEE